ncbi:ABC-type multidrug transport system ATPase subunit [Actinokineospora baliensis]|uniref:ABC transporter ATP-binding protein n=1 Tax=Actinokineospora baliensis TaxID=547056 RepID=UPI0027DDB5B3|nr:ABC transporter ATP-binding protein [Actinokineospora baliensis]MBM7773764.1 ABC-type multidrug transport system ATPase subunit [Actinokineospora baliensis]
MAGASERRVEVVAVTAAVGSEVLFADVTFAVGPGECVVVSGRNGSGKSTLLGCLYGTRQVSSGVVRVGGMTPDERKVGFRRRVSVVLDDSALFDELSARQHLDLLLRSFPAVDHRGVDGWLRLAGLDERADVPALGLSAGQRRRLLLTGAVARDHDVLLLDEPERALDTAGREWLTGLIAAERRRGTAVVVASHHGPLADRVGAARVELG